MRRSACRTLALLLPILVLTLTSAQAQTESGFTLLFDGKELTGWRYGKEVLHRAGETPDKRFSISDGTIVLAAKDKDGRKDTQQLLTVREFAKDFILKLEFKAANEAIGSVLVRNQAFPVGDFLRRGEQKKMKKFRTDDWNEVEIQVRMVARVENRPLTDSDNLELTFANGKTMAKLNGKPIDPNPVVIRIEASARCNGEVLTGAGSASVASTGTVGLRSGFGKLEFRNIRFKELP
jgi:hypothetical protein